MPDPKVDYKIGEPPNTEPDTPDAEEEEKQTVDEGLDLPLEERRIDPRSPQEKLADKYRRAQRDILENPERSPWPGTTGWEPGSWAPPNNGRKG